MNERFMEAARNGDTKTALALLAEAQDIAARIELLNQTQDGMTALMLASENGHAATAVALIAGGANVNAVDQYGITVLMWASINGHTATVAVLIAKGVNVNSANQHGDTALKLASGHGHAATVEILIAGGANVDAEDRGGRTALMWASGNGDTAIVVALIAGGANVNAVDQSGRTALMWASRNGHTATAAIIEMGLKGLQDACKERDDGVSGMFPGCMHNSSLKNIIRDYDCPPELEYLSPVLVTLKDSIERQKNSGQTSNKSATGSSPSSSPSSSSSSPPSSSSSSSSPSFLHPAISSYPRNIANGDIETKERKEEDEGYVTPLAAYEEQRIPNTEQAQIELAIANSLRDSESHSVMTFRFGGNSSPSSSSPSSSYGTPLSSPSSSSVESVLFTPVVQAASTSVVVPATPVQEVATPPTAEQRRAHQNAASKRRRSP